MDKWKVATILVTLLLCITSVLMVIAINDNVKKVTDVEIIDSPKLVEAKSENYVPEYNENGDIEGVTNDQSEILTDNTEGSEIVEENTTNEVKATEQTNNETAVSKDQNNDENENVDTSEELVSDTGRIDEYENLESNNEVTEKTNNQEVVENNNEEQLQEIMEMPSIEDANTDKEAVIVYKKASEYEGVIPNEMNDIVVAMYHGVDNKFTNADPVHRSVDGFKKDLKRLYDNGYRAIPMQDLIDNNINVPTGYTPVVLTFDDGLSTSFSLQKDASGNLIPRKDSAVDLINKFNEKYPDFGTHAIFYIYTAQTPFAGAGTFADALDYLVSNGYEVGSHTYQHPYLDRFDAEGVQRQMGYSVGYVRKVDKDVKMTSIAYPYGVMPKEEFKQYALEGDYKGYDYKFDMGFMATPTNDTSTLKYSKRFDKYRVGRYRGTDNAVTDLNWKIEHDKINGKQFISDGNPNTVTIREKDFDKINLEQLKGKTLIVVQED